MANQTKMVTVGLHDLLEQNQVLRIQPVISFKSKNRSTLVKEALETAIATRRTYNFHITMFT
jgi:hypothetical protein